LIHVARLEAVRLVCGRSFDVAVYAARRAVDDTLAPVRACCSEHVQRPADVDLPVMVVRVRDVPKRRGQMVDGGTTLRRTLDVVLVRELPFEDLDAGIRESLRALARTNEDAHGMPSCREGMREVITYETCRACHEHLHVGSL
jgi:hypothetical protein